MNEPGVFEPGTDWTMIPEHMRDAVRRYVEAHEPVGDFLTSVLSNDLSGAFLRADDANAAALGDYVRFLTWFAPSPCWGSPARVKAWLEREPVIPDPPPAPPASHDPATRS